MQLSSLLTGRARKRWAAAALGAAAVLAFQPYALVWLAPLALACLVLLWEDESPRQAWWLGLCFGLGLFAAGTYWLYISLNILGGLWPPIALLMMFCLVAATASYVGLTGWLSVWLVPQAGLLRWLVVFPLVWTLTEWLRGWLFTGFPWLSLGYSQVETPLGALAPVLGVYGVTWLVALFAGAAVTLVQGQPAARFIAATTGVAALVSLVNLDAVKWTQSSGEELAVTLVQGAVPQELKWQRDQLDPTLELYTRLSLEQGEPDLLIWPEAAIPALPFEIPEYLERLQLAMVEQDTQLLTGILTFDPTRGEYRNTLWAIGPDQGMYYKRHLVAFGEYFPLPDFAKRVLRIMNLPSEDIAAGAPDQALLTVQGIPVAATICYELAFGAEQLGFFPAAQLMVNVSNDAWFGDSIAPHHHLQIGQMRARETGRYLLRATNTGLTGVVAPSGQVTATIPQFEPGVLNAIVQPHVGTTPYIRFGNWPILLMACVILASAALIRVVPLILGRNA